MPQYIVPPGSSCPKTISGKLLTFCMAKLFGDSRYPEIFDISDILYKDLQISVSETLGEAFGAVMEKQKASLIRLVNVRIKKSRETVAQTAARVELEKVARTRAVEKKKFKEVQAQQDAVEKSLFNAAANADVISANLLQSQINDLIHDPEDEHPFTSPPHARLARNLHSEYAVLIPKLNTAVTKGHRDSESCLCSLRAAMNSVAGQQDGEKWASDLLGQEVADSSVRAFDATGQVESTDRKRGRPAGATMSTFPNIKPIDNGKYQ
jgi:hypothetical protein